MNKSFAALAVCAALLAAAPTSADLPQGAAGPAALAPLTIFRDCADCPEMIVIPPGQFMMGAIPGESRNPFDFTGENPTFRRRGADEISIVPFEHPRHPVEMDIPFAMARNEVTRAEWMACVAEGGCTVVPDHHVLTLEGPKAMGPDHPVIKVSFLDVQQYVDWLNTKAGAEVYRLPTEAEWEYAARAGTKTPFAQGDVLTPDQANFSGLGTAQLLGAPQPGLPDRREPVEVDALDAANPWGLRHMSGNVSEMTLSCWTETQPGLASDSAYLAHAAAQASCWRTVKGGSFTSGMDWCRLAVRTRRAEDIGRDSLGFRVIRELDT